MFKFLGKLMGIAIRNQEYLPLDLPSLVWKKLVGDVVTEEDLAGVDLMLVESMQKLRTVETMGVDAESFNDIFMETFTVTTMDGRYAVGLFVTCCFALLRVSFAAHPVMLIVCSTVELYPGGADVDVTFDTRHKFADMVIDFRYEYQSACCAAAALFNIV